MTLPTAGEVARYSRHVRRRYLTAHLELTAELELEELAADA